MATPGGGWRRAQGPSAQKRVKRKRKGGGRGRDGDPTVEDAEFQSYYGRQIVKSAVWKTPDVPLYLFLGGAAGSSAVLGAGAEFTGRPALARTAHLIAGGGAIASVGFLIHDLGRPERFLHMLRVFKPTSPLSVGSYILSPFSALTGAAAALTIAEKLDWVPRWVKTPALRKTAGVGGAVFGGPMAAYTAVLLANTATPSWHEPGTSCRSCSPGRAWPPAAGCAWRSPRSTRPARRARPPSSGRPSSWPRCTRWRTTTASSASRTTSGGPGSCCGSPRPAPRPARVGAAVLGGRRWGAVASGALLAAGSALTRFGVFDAGMASSKDPKYVVIPQRERMAAPPAGVRRGLTPGGWAPHLRGDRPAADYPRGRGAGFPGAVGEGRRDRAPDRGGASWTRPASRPPRSAPDRRSAVGPGFYGLTAATAVAPLVALPAITSSAGRQASPPWCSARPSARRRRSSC